MMEALLRAGGAHVGHCRPKTKIVSLVKVYAVLTVDFTVIFFSSHKATVLFIVV